MRWFKKQPKEPVKSQEVKIEDLIANVYMLNPDLKYIFWFEQPMNPAHMIKLREYLGQTLGDELKKVEGTEFVSLRPKWMLIAGVKCPKIFEMKE